MAKFYVKDVVCDYGIFDDRDDLRHTMILNSHRNAELIAAIMNTDEEHKVFEASEVAEVEKLKKEKEYLTHLITIQENKIADLEQELEEYEEFNDYEEPEPRIKPTDKYYELLKLIKENPELEIVPMVENEGLCDDFAWLMGSWGSAKLEEYYVGDERVYFRECDEEDLVQELIDNNYDDDWKGKTDEEMDKLAENIVRGYNWIKCIAVYIKTT